MRAGPGQDAAHQNAEAGRAAEDEEDAKEEDAGAPRPLALRQERVRPLVPDDEHDAADCEQVAGANERPVKEEHEPERAEHESKRQHDEPVHPRLGHELRGHQRLGHLGVVREERRRRQKFGAAAQAPGEQRRRR